MNYSIKFIFLFILLLDISFVVGQSTQEAKKNLVENPKFEARIDRLLSESVDFISVDSLSKLRSDFVLLDTREKEEFDVSHIPNALYFGYRDLDYSVLKNIENNTTVVVYCSIGYRSEKIGEKLKRMGFTNVFNLYGSIFEWANQAHPLEDVKGLPTQKIHGYNKKWSKWITNKNAEVTY